MWNKHFIISPFSIFNCDTEKVKGKHLDFLTYSSPVIISKTVFSSKTGGCSGAAGCEGVGCGCIAGAADAAPFLNATSSDLVLLGVSALSTEYPARRCLEDAAVDGCVLATETEAAVGPPLARPTFPDASSGLGLLGLFGESLTFSTRMVSLEDDRAREGSVSDVEVTSGFSGFFRPNN